MMTKDEYDARLGNVPQVAEDPRTIPVSVYPSANEQWCVLIQRVSDRLVIEGRYHDVVSRADSIIRAMEPGCY